jgi:hypothetical protein
MIVSERFWEFVDDVNWMEVNKNPGKFIGKIPQTKSVVRPILDIYTYRNKVVEISILPKYSWEEFEQFEKDYRSKYHAIYSKLEKIWLSDDLPDDAHISDDSYTDFCSSVVGKGKEFCEYILREEEYQYLYEAFVDMVSKGDYYENFAYIFHYEDEERYKKLRRELKLKELGI